MLRHPADWRSVLVIGLVTGNFALQWAQPSPSGWLLALSALLALPMASMAHNHHHVPIFRPAWMNLLASYWFTFFYGLPAISWLVVHNQGHHGAPNVRGVDPTSTFNSGDRQDLVGVLLYAPTSMPLFFRVHVDAFRRYWRQRRGRFWFYLSHVLFLHGGLAALLWLDWERALLYVLLPQGVAITCITVFNYCQHVHTPLGTELQVARNFLSPVLNAYLFNVGFHTVHHQDATAHWSDAPRAHAAIAPKLDPRLEEGSFWRWFGRRIVLATFFARHRTAPVDARPASAG